MARNVPPRDSEQAHALVPATLIVGGRYAIAEEIGRGGSAIVYKATDRKTGSEVAVKRLRRELVESVSTQRFVREVRLLGELRHPNIVTIIDAGVDAGLPPTPFCVMPLVKGGTLAKRLAAERALPVADVIRIAADVAGALDFAHAYGVLHRDIKPQNILFDGTRTVVSDFGIARAIQQSDDERITESGVVLGTPLYMSPEQADGEGPIDGRSDVYSLGCVVYEMLAGEAPFTAPSAQGVIAKHRTEPVPRIGAVRPGLGDGVQRVLETALAKVPVDRYATAGEFVRALAGALHRPSAPVHASTAPTRRAARPMVLAPVGVTIVAMTAFIFALLSRHPRTPVFEPRRVAVTYFTSLTPGDSTAFLADALTESLIDELSAVPTLHVISPAGVRPYRNRAVTTDSLARALNIGTIISGSLQYTGDSLRVVMRLVDATSGDVRYSETIPFPTARVAALQDSVIKAGAFALMQHLGQNFALRTPRSSTSSTEAWEAAQDARNAQRDASEAHRRSGGQAAGVNLGLRADRLYARAESLDTRWALPTLGRATLARIVASWSDSVPLPVDARAIGPAPNRLRWLRWARLLADRAAAKGADNAEVFAVDGALDYDLALMPASNRDSLISNAERLLRTAVSARPQLPGSWKTLAQVYVVEGRSREAEDAAERAYDADAFFEVRETLSIAFLASLYSRQFDRAASWCQKGLTRYPDDVQFAECRLRLMGWQSGATRGDIDTAWRELAALDNGALRDVLQPSWGFRRAMVAMVIARAGLRDSALHVLDAVRRAQRSDPTIVLGLQEQAYIQILIGRRDSAVTLLDTLLYHAPFARSLVAKHPWFEPLHGMPRFDDAVRGTR